MGESALVQQEIGELKAKIEILECKSEALEKDIGIEPDKDERLAKRAELTAILTNIAALRNQITELRKSQGNFLFVLSFFFVEWGFLLAPVFFFHVLNIYLPVCDLV